MDFLRSVEANSGKLSRIGHDTEYVLSRAEEKASLNNGKIDRHVLNKNYFHRLHSFVRYNVEKSC